MRGWDASWIVRIIDTKQNKTDIENGSDRKVNENYHNKQAKVVKKKNRNLADYIEKEKSSKIKQGRKI